MCGIFGYSWGRGDLPPDKDYLMTDHELYVRDGIMKATERGGHAWGLYGIRGPNDHVYIKMHGKTDVELAVSLMRGCKVAIFHSRLSTTGDNLLLNAQPLLTAKGALVHNGTVPEARDLCAEASYVPHTGSDSEAIFPAWETEKMGFVRGAMLLIDIDEYQWGLEAWHNDLPLHHSIVNDVTYFCSKPLLHGD